MSNTMPMTSALLPHAPVPTAVPCPAPAFDHAAAARAGVVPIAVTRSFDGTGVSIAGLPSLGALAVRDDATGLPPRAAPV